jgi:hypothetical protein
VWNDLNAGWPSSDARDAERPRCSVTCDALSHVNARGLVLLGRKPPTVTPQYGQPGGAGLAVARRVDGCEDDVRLRRYAASARQPSHLILSEGRCGREDLHVPRVQRASGPTKRPTYRRSAG